jgi:hypothetical protein
VSSRRGVGRGPGTEHRWLRGSMALGGTPNENLFLGIIDGIRGGGASMLAASVKCDSEVEILRLASSGSWLVSWQSWLAHRKDGGRAADPAGLVRKDLTSVVIFVTTLSAVPLNNK